MGATHCHFDHSGGLHNFSEVWVHKKESKSVREGNQQASVSWLSDEEVVPKPRPDWSASEYKVKAAHVTRELQDGDIILGMQGTPLAPLPFTAVHGNLSTHSFIRYELF